jgi:hypothetical protein
VSAHPLYSLIHVEVGPLATFLTCEDAEREREAVLRDEPTWAPDLVIRRIEFSVAVGDEGFSPS